MGRCFQTNKPVILFFLLMFIIGTDTFLISPLLPVLTERFSISTQSSGWLVGAYALGYAVFALIAGPLSDGWDRRKTLTWGMLSFSVFTFLCGWASGFVPMFVFRFLAGVSAAFASPQIWASIPLIVNKQQIVKVMGIVTAGLSVAQLLGVPLASFLAAFHWSTAFYIIGLTAFALTLSIRWFLPSLPPEAAPVSAFKSIFSRYRALFRPFPARKAFLAYGFYHTAVFAAYTFIGTFLSREHGLDLKGVGAVMAVLGAANLAGSLTSGWWVNKLGVSRTFLAAMAVIIADYLSLPVWSGLLPVQLALMVIIYSGSVLFPLMMSVLQSLAPGARGTVSSLANALMYAGTTIGSSAAGAVYGWGAFAWVSWFSAACFTVAVVFFTASGAMPPVYGSDLRERSFNNGK